MRLSLHDIEFLTDIPEIPSSMPLAVTDTPCGHDRVRSVRAVADVLGLKDALEVETPFGFALASKAGQVEHFSASGAVRARDAQLINRFQDERREWSDVRKVETRSGIEYAFGDKASRILVDQSQEMLKGVGLLADFAGVDVTLGRWALLDEDGRELESGPGRATVRMSYAVEGIPLIGAGAKTNLHYDPIDGAPALARMFHVHRPVADVRPVDTGDPDQAFEGLLADPFLLGQVGAGGHVVVTGVKVGLLALPADTPQRIAYPALAVEGRVVGLQDKCKGDYELHFGRYFPAVSADALRRAGVVLAGPTRHQTAAA